MLTVEYSDNLLKTIKKIKDNTVKEQIKRQIAKILENPEIGKPMRYARKGTRELYIGYFPCFFCY